LAVFLVALFIAMPAAADDVAAVARLFYSRYAAGDLSGIIALWAPDAPDLPRFRQRVAGILRARCQTLHRIEVRSDGAHAEIEALISSRSRTGPARLEQHFASLDFEHRGGEWRIVHWQRREDALADAIASTKTDSERRCALQHVPQWITPYLGEQLAARSLMAINQQRWSDAAALAQLLRELSVDQGDLAGESAAEGLESILERSVAHDIAASLRHGRRALELAEASGDPDAIVRAALRLNRAERSEGSLRRDGFERVMSMADDVTDVSTVAHAASRLAEYYDMLGDHRMALRYAYITEKLAAASGDVFARMSAEMNIGGAYRAQADEQLSAVHYERGVALARLSGSRSQTAHLLYLLSLSYERLGRGADMLRAIAEGLSLLQGDEANDLVSLLLGERALYRARHGDTAHAEEDVQEAICRGKLNPRENSLYWSLRALALIRMEEKRYVEALAVIAEASGSSLPDGFELGVPAERALRRLGHRAEAYRVLDYLLRNLEIERRGLVGDEQVLQNAMADRAAASIDMVEMLVEDHREAEALRFAEEAKGRSLLDSLRRGSALAEEQVSAEDRTRLRQLEARESAANAEILAAHPSPGSVTALRDARLDLDLFRGSLYARYPRLRAQQESARPVTADEIGMMLGERDAFVEFVMTESRVIAFVVRRQGKDVVVRAHRLPIRRRELERRVASFVRKVAEIDVAYRAPARSLYDQLLAPLANDLRGITTIGFIPDGALWHLPFEALVAPDGRFVVERLACFYAPSITVSREMSAHRRCKRSGRLLAFADPPLPKPDRPVAAKLRDGEYAALPEAVREVKTVARLYGSSHSRVYIGAAASERRAKKESEAYDVIHFATHGVFDDDNPMYSHILLAPSVNGDPTDDGLLETWEVMRLNLHAELVVLSACETARGSVHRGEGLVGLTWGLFVAGCSSTIATQWKVSSASAEEVMVEFYRAWRAGASKAEALRRARTNVLHDGRHRHPFHWAGFVLMGAP
jgi:CHAT domain-containing protein